MTCRDCGRPIEEGTGTEVYGCPGEVRCRACMRVRTAAGLVLREGNGEKLLEERGHSERSAYRKKAKSLAGKCEACEAPGPRICDACRELGERYWIADAMGVLD